MDVKSICRCVTNYTCLRDMSTCCTPRVHIDELDGVNAARQSVEAQLEAVPSVEQQVVTMARLVETLDSLWDMPPRKAAAMLQAVRVRVLCEEGQVVRAAFGVAL